MALSNSEKKSITEATPKRESRWDPRPHHDDPNIKTYDYAYLEGVPDPTLAKQAFAALKTVLSPLLTQPLLLRTLLLIFGGCCSNVYALESILNLSSSTGTLITFLQFVFITLFTLPSQLTFHKTSPPEPPPLRPTQWTWLPRLKRRRVPLKKWLLFAGQFVMINVLNNAAFGYKISLPLHIILRSAGPVASMLVGYVWTDKRYSSRKVKAVALLFAGVVLAAQSDAGSKSSSAPAAPQASGSSNTTAAAGTAASDTTSALLDQGPGFALLTAALLLSAILGVWSDGIYSRYGRTPAIADEQLFYGHLLSLPFFAVQYSTLRSQYGDLMEAGAKAFPLPAPKRKDLSGLPPMAILMHGLAGPPQKTWQELAMQVLTLEQVPKAIIYLALNGITQIACITGVHHLSTQTSALTVSIILNVRKVVSLLLSIYLFGNSLPMGVLVGAAVVFFGGGLYGIPDEKPKKQQSEGDSTKESETKKNR